MDTIRQALDAASWEAVTRQPPKSATALVAYLLRQEGGSRARVAALLGVSPTSVGRYVRGQRTPAPRVRERLDAAVRDRWQPRVKARARKTAAAQGLVVETRARFGFTAAGGSTDDPRMRRLTQPVPPAFAQQLLDAHAAGATESELQALLAASLGETYFRDGGRRAGGLDVSLTAIDYIEIELPR